MKLTYELLHLSASDGVAGWNREQLELMGVKWPPTKGWLTNLIGTEIAEDTWAKVMALSGVKKKLKRKEILKGQGNLI